MQCAKSKCESKVLALRLRDEFLDEIIAEEQSAFVPGHLMAKAYDRIEWEYLRWIMLELGFHEFFVNLIMSV